MKATLAAAVVTTTSAIKVDRMDGKSHSKPTLTRVTDPYELGSLGYYPEVNINQQSMTPNDLLSKDSYPCLFRLDNAFFDFTPFKLAQNVWPAIWPNMTDIDPPTVPDPTWRPSSDWSYQWQYGFCQQMNEANNATCASNQNYAIGSTLNGTALAETEDLATQPPTDCQPFSGTSAKNNIEATTIEKLVNVTDNSGNLVAEKVTGVAITYTGGECPSTGGPATFTIKAWCNQSIAIENTEYSGEAYLLNDDLCNPYVEITSSIGGCDLLQNSMIWDYAAYAEPYIGVIAIVGGLAMTFFGLRLVKPSICFAGFLSCIMLTLLFFYAVYANSIDDLATFYYWMGGGAVVGVLVGYFLSYFVKVGAAILAGWGGFMLGLMLNEAVLYNFKEVWVFWTANVLCALIAAALTFKQFENMMIFSTCTLGSYCLIRGVSCYAGHYYNEFVVIKLLQSGAIDQIDPYYWGYVGGFIVFAIVGAWYQKRMVPKQRVATHPYHRYH